MKPMQLTVVSIVVAAFLSGMAASGITLVVQNHLSQRDAKRDVLGRLAGFRYLLAAPIALWYTANRSAR